MATCQGNRKLDVGTETFGRYIADFLVVGLVVGLSILISGGNIFLDENLIEISSETVSQNVAEILGGSEDITSNLILETPKNYEVLFRKLVDFISKFR